MLLINLPGTDPCFNLAVDEYFLKEREEDFFILGSNSPSVIIGKHQVAHKEADTRFVNEHEIPVIRRISGGGAVYHDAGNLNFSFIVQSSAGKQVDFRKYTAPVLSFLESMGITAKFEGKNDLRVDGLKISGNAEHVHRERVLHHGTLLFDTDIISMKGSLRSDRSLYETRAVDSNPSKVVNVRRYLPESMGTNEFREALFDFFLKKDGNKQIFLSEQELLAISDLAKTKYQTWDWNYAYGPEYNFSNSIVFKDKRVDVKLFVKDGLVKECGINGFNGSAYLAGSIKGNRHMPADLGKIIGESQLAGTDIYSFF